MENLSIAIVSADRNYGKALCMSLMNVCKDFVIKLFDNRQFVNEWSCYKGKGAYYDCFDLVLWAGSEISDAYGGNIIYLADKASLIRKDFEGKRFCLYKYSPAQTLVAAIFEIYSFLTGRNATFMPRNNVDMVAFASWTGGCGCTTLAMAVAQELCRFRDKRVMYVSLEDVESTGSFIEHSVGPRSTGEYLYRLFREFNSCIPASIGDMPFLDGYVIKDLYGIEAFAPTRGKNPLRELTEHEIQKFLASLIDSGRYDVVILDMGSCLTEAGLAAMQLAEKICFVSTPEREGTREEQYLSHIIFSIGESTLDKSMKVVNLAHGYPDSSEGHDSSADILETRSIIRQRVNPAIGVRQSGFLDGDFGEDIHDLTAGLFD